ncbi:elongation factor 1-beta [Candidatus Woesearchaeota archaeon]|nr:elongation factor 1-beta [Candidatus Woesearchaeota archaeon]
MATVIVTMKVMPSSPDEDLDFIKSAAAGMIAEFGGTVGKTELEPIAFGLKAVVFMFAMAEDLGDTEELEKKIAAISGINSVQVTDVRRAIG